MEEEVLILVHHIIVILGYVMTTIGPIARDLLIDFELFGHFQLIIGVSDIDLDLQDGERQVQVLVLVEEEVPGAEVFADHEGGSLDDDALPAVVGVLEVGGVVLGGDDVLPLGEGLVALLLLGGVDVAVVVVDAAVVSPLAHLDPVSYLVVVPLRGEVVQQIGVFQDVALHPGVFLSDSVVVHVAVDDELARDLFVGGVLGVG